MWVHKTNYKNKPPQKAIIYYFEVWARIGGRGLAAVVYIRIREIFSYFAFLHIVGCAAYGEFHKEAKKKKINISVAKFDL